MDKDNMLSFIKEYSQHANFCLIGVTVLITAALVIVNDMTAFYKTKESDSKLKNMQQAIDQKLTLISNAVGLVIGEWQTVDLSKGVPPVIANGAFIIIRSKSGTIEGFLKGAGYNEQYPFNTDLNNNIPVCIKIKEPKMEYIVTSPKDRKVSLEMFVAGYKMNR